jgi:hypothetical protein
MKHKSSQTLYAYWNEVRGQRMAPRRFEIEPTRIASILAETFILERIDAQTYRFRLAGTKICETFGTEFRGKNFLDLWGREDQLSLERHLAHLTEHSGVGLFSLTGVATDGRATEFEALLLPLVHTRATVDRFLGTLAAVDPPHWLGSVRILETRLQRNETIWPEGRPHALAFGRNQAPFLPRIRQGRLVKSERRSFRVFDGGLAETQRNDK